MLCLPHMHAVPADLKKALAAAPARVRAAWEDNTPLARNEWICWVTSAKLAQTRERRIRQTTDKLASGLRRPCCWAGCPHR